MTKQDLILDIETYSQDLELATDHGDVNTLTQLKGLLFLALAEYLEQFKA